ncbi:DsbA family protein [Nitratireductor sp. StC3]|uniref:DsbA family protein n=1 Tax=Nitratireductor sp. StC3 TaxID=2126741 RepID=UPI000D0DA3E3|nr:DsbA family protein [Nitratireductor sp. StC3]PSM18331.1 disulfide bond formation protein DsbA [Nitratireductor sp. StC3]
MTRFVSRRNVVASLATLPAAALLAACSDSNGASAPETPETPKVAVPEAQGSVDIDKLMEPGALPEKWVGDEDAPVTIVEYASTTCGHCGNFHRNTYPALKEKYIDTGKARLVLREFPFDPRAEAGFMLARCADDKYFAMADVLFKQQDAWVSVENAREALLKIARLAGFSQESFEACLTDQKLLEDVRAVKDRGAKEFGVDSTPTFFVNGKKYAGAMSIDEFSAIIDSML